MNEGERKQKKEKKEEISLQEGGGAGICFFRRETNWFEEWNLDVVS